MNVQHNGGCYMKKSTKKEAILNSAEKLFYQHGFHAVGVKSILDHAGAAPMTMYYHFKSKEEVIKEILMQRDQRYLRGIEDTINKEEGINSYIESLFKAHIDWIETKGSNGCLFLRAKQEYEGVNDEIAALSQEHKQSFLNKIENDLELFHAPKSLGMQITIILEGLTAMVQITELNKVKEAAAELMKNLHISEDQIK